MKLGGMENGEEKMKNGKSTKLKPFIVQEVVWAGFGARETWGSVRPS